MVPLANKNDFFRIHIAAAVYCITDMIIFNVLQKYNDGYYLHIVIQKNEIEEVSFLYKWCDIPKCIAEMYQYVISKSNIEIDQYNNYVLYGTHIGRSKDYKYTLNRFDYDPLNYVEIEEETICPSTDDNNFIVDIALHTKTVKNI
jgi:hypothetical protein